jgi:hypothetical protein
LSSRREQAAGGQALLIVQHHSRIIAKASRYKEYCMASSPCHLRLVQRHRQRTTTASTSGTRDIPREAKEVEQRAAIERGTSPIEISGLNATLERMDLALTYPSELSS